MEPTLIRPAMQDDVLSLCQLALAFHEFHAAGVPDRLNSIQETFETATIYDQLTRILNQSNATIFVAVRNDRLLGFVELYLREDNPNPARQAYKYGYVQSLMVAQSERGNGIGTLLMQAAHKWVSEQEASEIRLDVWEFPNGPLPFYEKFGYITLRRRLVHKLKEGSNR